MASASTDHLYTGTTVASTVDTITSTRQTRIIEIRNTGTLGALYARADGVAPTVKGADCYVVPVGQSTLIHTPVMQNPLLDTVVYPSVQIISATVNDYTVNFG
jgi:hypothetical protein